MPDRGSARTVRSMVLLVAALVVGYLLVPQLGGAGRSLRLVTEVNPALLLAGIMLRPAPSSPRRS